MDNQRHSFIVLSEGLPFFQMLPYFQVAAGIVSLPTPLWSVFYLPVESSEGRKEKNPENVQDLSHWPKGAKAALTAEYQYARVVLFASSQRTAVFRVGPCNMENLSNQAY